MTDIASLAFKIDSSQAKTATSDLDGMSTAASKAQAAALMLQRSLEQGRLSFDQYAQGMLLLGNNAVAASRSIDDMVDRVTRLSRAITDIGGDAGRPLRDAIAQLQGLGQQFGTGAAGIENFARASRDIGLSAQETVSALQRIQLAIEGVTEQGRQARQVLEGMGVSLRNAGRNDAGEILRQFRDRVGYYADDINMTRSINTVLGPTSAETMMALTWPDYRTEAQRRRELQDSVEFRRQAELRESMARAQRTIDFHNARYNDLRSNYSSWFDWRDWDPTEDRASELERWMARQQAGERPFNLAQLRRSFDEGLIGRNIQRRRNGAIESDRQALGTLRDLDSQDGVGFVRRNLDYYYRYYLEAPFAGRPVITENERDRINSAAQEREGPPLIPVEDLVLSEAFESQRILAQAEARALRQGGNLLDAARARMLESAALEAARKYPNRWQGQERQDFINLQRMQFDTVQVPMLRARSDSQLWHQINILRAGTEERARGDIGAAAMAQARAQADANGLTDPRLLLHVMAAQGEFRASVGLQTAGIQGRTMERLAELAGSGMDGTALGAEMRRAQTVAQYAEPIAIAKMLGLDKAAEEIERFAKQTADAADRIGASATKLNLNLMGRDAAAGHAMLAETAGMDPRGRVLQGRADAVALQILGKEIDERLPQRERLQMARARLREDQGLARRVEDMLGLQDAEAAQASEGTYRGQLALITAGTTGDPRSDRYARLNAQLYAISQNGNLSDIERARQVNATQAGFQADEARRYNAFALSQDYALQDAALRLSRFGVTGITDGIAPVSPGGEIFRNNPLNLRPSRAQWEGQTGTLGGFLTFSAPEYGVRAALLNAQTQLGRSDGTLRGLISRWAPTSDGNNVDAYTDFVATRLGISATDRLNLQDPFVARSLMASMARFETGREVDFGVISRGVSMAQGRGGLPASAAGLPAIAGAPQAFSPRLTYDQAMRALYDTSGIEVEQRVRSAMRSDSSNDEATVRFKETLLVAAQAIERLGTASARATLDIENNSRVSAARARSGLAGNIEGALVGAQPEIEGAKLQAADLRRKAATESDPARAQAMRSRADELEALANDRPGQIRQGILRGSHDAFTEESAALDRQGRVYELQLRNPFASDLTQARNIALFRAEQDLRYRYTDPKTGDMAISEEEIQQRLGTVARQFDQQQLIRQNQEVRDTFVGIAQASGSALEQIIMNGGRARIVMAQLTGQISQMLMTLAMKPVNNMIGNMLSSAVSWGVGLLSGSGGNFNMASVGANLTSVGGVPNATGNVFDRGHLVPMAQGDVFEGIAMRPMAGGNTAMMGEAGPEAAVPLVRLPSGNLGVRTSGGAGVFAPSITINMNGGGGGGAASAEQARQVAELVQKALKQQQEEMVRDQMRVGGVFNPIYRR